MSYQKLNLKKGELIIYDADKNGIKTRIKIDNNSVSNLSFINDTETITNTKINAICV